MPPTVLHSGDLSQDSARTPAHRTDVNRTGAIVDPASKRTRGLFQTLSMSSMGLEFGLSVVIGLLFGRWLDGQAGTDPWLMILFLMFGFAAGVRSILRGLARAERFEARERARNGGGSDGDR